ncbi:hypothetical protein O3P69_012003, partial [Scylla paramamosain]
MCVCWLRVRREVCARVTQCCKVCVEKFWRILRKRIKRRTDRQTDRQGKDLCFVELVSSCPLRPPSYIFSTPPPPSPPPPPPPPVLSHLYLPGHSCGALIDARCSLLLSAQ